MLLFGDSSPQLFNHVFITQPNSPWNHQLSNLSQSLPNQIMHSSRCAWNYSKCLLWKLKSRIIKCLSNSDSRFSALKRIHRISLVFVAKAKNRERNSYKVSAVCLLYLYSLRLSDLKALETLTCLHKVSHSKSIQLKNCTAYLGAKIQTCVW